MPQRYILWLQSASIVPAKEKFAFFCLAALLEWLAMIGMQAIRMVINMLQHQRWINLKFKFVSKGFASKALVGRHVYRWAPGTLQYSSIFKVNFKVQKGWVCDYLRTSAMAVWISSWISSDDDFLQKENQELSVFPKEIAWKMLIFWFQYYRADQEALSKHLGTEGFLLGVPERFRIRSGAPLIRERFHWNGWTTNFLATTPSFVELQNQTALLCKWLFEKAIRHHVQGNCRRILFKREIFRKPSG